jgi:two-component system, chemotaxis family, chemotaxis protein CheY
MTAGYVPGRGTTEEAPVLASAIRVLVVDDTEHVRAVVADMLRLDGFQVVGQAAGVQQALELAAATDPHVVVMDLKMPDVDGIEGARRLRALRPEQLVVLYTAYLDEEVERLARDAGIALCLAKVDGLPRLEREIVRLTLGAG